MLFQSSKPVDQKICESYFVGDATATVNDELHLASLKNLGFGFAPVVSTDQVCGWMGEKMEMMENEF
jgi:isochorismate hydrolase